MLHYNHNTEVNMLQIDTLAFAKRLIEAGMNAEIAEAQAELQSDVLMRLTKEKLASKEDIHSLDNRMDGLNNRIDSLGSRIDSLGSRMDNLESKVDNMDTSLTKRIDGLETTVVNLGTSLVAKIDSSTKQLRQEMTLKLGSMMVTSIFVVVALMKLMHL